MWPVYALVVRFDLAPGYGEEFDRLVAGALPVIRQEPGTLQYVPFTVNGDPDAGIFYEAYADVAAFEAHEQYPHTVDFLAGIRALLRSDPRVEFLSPLD